MSRVKRNVCQSELKKYLKYEPSTGAFWRKIRTSNNMDMSKPAGGVGGPGYWMIALLGRRYLAHRLAWLYVHGEFPSSQIDHINGDRLDNRIENLRVASPGENTRNSRKRSTNTSGYKGVSWSKVMNKWSAEITVNRDSKKIGYFDCPKRAHAAYCREAEKYHKEFARTQ